MIKNCDIIQPNINNMEYYFGNKDKKLRITEICMNRVFAEEVSTGKDLGEIGSISEVGYYYDVV